MLTEWVIQLMLTHPEKQEMQKQRWEGLEWQHKKPSNFMKENSLRSTVCLIVWTQSLPPAVFSLSPTAALTLLSLQI